MSSVDDIYRKLGEQTEGNPEPVVTGVLDDSFQTRYKLAKRDIMRVLASMPDEAAIWNTVPGQSPEDAKRVIRDALWATLEPAIRKMVVAPGGALIEAPRE